ncbi:M91 family zinc metallopeptidase [Dysgonomonas capnocytophagoides]|uniref:M91 family zinc metallopeptidase n=1 Tax=Dysgonomonas capnocytophagoides TaxID=45254 RepID=UPI0029241A9C|nr:hypothetical protein DCPSUM001_20940 [Dysgonomonas capnocytophagoides]
MRKNLLTLFILLFSIYIYSQNENPFKQFGYDVLVASSSKGEFNEFHDQTDIVEIGSVLFNTKAHEIVKILDKDETTINISSATAAMSIDPLCEKYYWISPYAYVANNPLKYIDPDGRDILIYYREGQKLMGWSFTGSNAKNAPNNKYVQSVISAYNYNTNNGGGENLAKAATSEVVTVKVFETKELKNERGTLMNGKKAESVVKWNPNVGIETTDGKTMSPATMLEHEVAHEFSYQDDTAAHRDRQKSDDPKYDNKEEKRVIMGTEATTARANKEVPKNYTRPNHGGKRIITPNPISNKKIQYAN